MSDERPVPYQLPVPFSLAVIIPAKNEAKLIGQTLVAVRKALASFPHTVIVVDNLSTDGTQEIAVREGAMLLSCATGTIGALRNRGVSASFGEFVLFIDADVVVTDAWAVRLPIALRALRESPRTLTGSMCTVPRHASWLERVWFAPRDMMRSAHIGTGHLLTTRSFFGELLGFDERLATGEDYDFSVRAVEARGRVSPDPLLVAEHYGFPRTLLQFIRREAWHGRSDFTSLSRMLHSRVAVATVLFGAAHLLVVVGFVMRSPWLLAAGAVVTIGLCAMSSFQKFRGQPLRIIVSNCLVFYAYYLGRLLALLRVPLHRQATRAEAGAPPSLPI